MLAAGLCVPLSRAHAQPGKLPRVGVLTVAADEPFPEALRELGYEDGRTVVLDVRKTDGKPDQLDQAVRELVGLRPDVIVALYPGAVFTARRASGTIPIVMVNTPDPVDLGLAASLARPGGNITGMTSLSVDMSLKQLELFKEAVPRASRVAVLWNPDNPWHPITVKGLRQSGRTLGMQPQFVPIREPGDFDKAYRAVLGGRAQGVLILADPMTYAHRRELASLSLKHRLPAIGSLREYAEAGCLLSYWADTTDLLRRAASFVDRLLKGARAGDLPIEQARKFDLTVNRKTAATLGLTISPSLLVRADRVFQ